MSCQIYWYKKDALKIIDPNKRWSQLLFMNKFRNQLKRDRNRGIINSAHATIENKRARQNLARHAENWIQHSDNNRSKNIA